MTWGADSQCGGDGDEELRSISFVNLTLIATYDYMACLI